MEECSQSQGIWAFPLWRACKETWWWESIRIYWFCNRDFITQFLWHQSTIFFFSCILICDMPVAKPRQTEGRGTRRISVKTENPKTIRYVEYKNKCFFWSFHTRKKQYHIDNTISLWFTRKWKPTNKINIQMLVNHDWNSYTPSHHRSYTDYDNNIFSSPVSATSVYNTVS